MSLDENAAASNPRQIQRMQTLIIGPLLAIFLISITS
jgi:hypothetical protein